MTRITGDYIGAVNLPVNARVYVTPTKAYEHDGKVIAPITQQGYVRNGDLYTAGGKPFELAPTPAGVAVVLIVAGDNGVVVSGAFSVPDVESVALHDLPPVAFDSLEGVVIPGPPGIDGTDGVDGRDGVDGEKGERGTIADEDFAEYVANPETASFEAVESIVRDALGGGADSLIRVSKATLTNISAPRPEWAGIVLWFVPLGSVAPINYRSGDLIVEVEVGPMPWSPSAHAQLRAWWNPANSGVANGTAVESVPDSSASGWPLTQTDIAKRPTFVADAINGKPGWLFDGTKLFQTLTIAGGKRLPSTFWAVIKGADVVNAGGSVFAFDMRNGSTALGGAAGRTAANKWYYITNSSGTSVTSSTDSDNQARIIAVRTDSAGVSTLYVNGVSVGTTTSTARDAFTSFVVGARADGLNGWKGYIGNVIIIGAAQSPGAGSSFEQTLNYLATLYGIAV